MVTPKLRLGAELSLPVDSVTQTFAILAKRRAGKSNAAVVMAEEMYAAQLPWVAIDPKGDWWGVRAAGSGTEPGLEVVVFGGLHGDVPLEPTSGALVADLVADRRLTCVLDVSEMTKADQRRFLTEFADRLYRVNREPLHVFAEEADEYIPQRVTAGDARMVGAWERLVKRGGFRGVGVTLVTQRSASLNKDVLSQTETMIAMRTTSPNDRKAIAGWVEYHSAGVEAVAELPLLGDGEAWVMSPQFLDTNLTKVQFRRRRTFDSGATPKVGGRPRPPARLAEVDLAEIKEAMAETIERAQADDPKSLRRRIRELESAAESNRPEVRVERVEVPILDPAVLAELGSTLDRLEKVFTTHHQQLAEEIEANTAALQQLAEVRRAITEAVSDPPPPNAPPRRRHAPAVPVDHAELSLGAAPPASRPSPTSRRDTHPDGVVLRSGARRMVEALGRMAPLRLSSSQWAMVSRLSSKGGTWATYLSDLRRAGFVDENSAGYTLTEAGFDYLGGRPEPMTATELQDHYRTRLRRGASKMLDAIIEAYPSALTREELGVAAELATTGGTFATYLSDLSRNGLVIKNGDQIVASEVLMHGADADLN